MIPPEAIDAMIAELDRVGLAVNSELLHRAAEMIRELADEIKRLEKILAEKGGD